MGSLLFAFTSYSTQPGHLALTPASSPPSTKSPPIFFQGLNSGDFYQENLKRALRNNASYQADSGARTWGVIVPHHLLAADVIASTLARLAGAKPDRIIILSPDHYLRGKTLFTTTGRDLKTTVGVSGPDRKLVESLRQLPNFAVNDPIFAAEHGIGAILPFVQMLWPKATVTPVLFRSNASARDLQELQNLLAEQVKDPNTLIIESTDFSHYLTAVQASVKDAQTISAISSGRPEEILNLRQPQNCDSLNILYLMKSIARSRTSRFELFIRKNSQDYFKTPLPETTSYLTYFISG